MAIYSRLTTSPLMNAKAADASPLDKPLFADGANSLALHTDTFMPQAGKLGGQNDADATSRMRRSKMLKISAAARNPALGNKRRKQGSPAPSANPTQG